MNDDFCSKMNAGLGTVVGGGVNVLLATLGFAILFCNSQVVGKQKCWV